MLKAGTYRIQLRPEFQFDDATNQVLYWQQLGISHVYCSPYLQAALGSAHGYDVVDHSSVNQELGGPEGRERFCAALAAHDLKQLLDIVPNHMAIRGGHNAWWWDVLENGPSSRYSSYFDVEWRASESERVLLPILADQYGVELEARKITVERREAELRVRYHEHENPLSMRSLGSFLKGVAARLKDAELGFVADGFAELPAPLPQDRASTRRRHRDKAILQAMLAQLLSRPDVADAVDMHIARINSSPDTLHELLEQQNYRLAHWRAGNQELDYRRFFDVDSLIGLRVEDDEVHDATHRLIGSWLQDGSVAGLRIDHIDGLYDPQGYLDRVRLRSATAWVLVEKILDEREELPGWLVAGTTGYEFLNQAQRVLVDAEGEAALTQLCTELVGEEQNYREIVRECKALVLRDALGSDVRRLTNRLAELCHRHRRFRDYSRADLELLLRELCIAFPVYRTYVHPDRPTSTQDTTTIRTVCKTVRENQQLDSRLVDFVERLLLLEWRGEMETDFVLRLQQLTGPVMAKGVEDTAFYRYVRLVALNEVGGNPENFCYDTDEFHELMVRRQACYPEALNATTTHDTKRSEDVRARLITLAEVPDKWAEFIRDVRQRVKTRAPRIKLDAGMEYLLWQNLVGAWPIEQERFVAVMLKSAREAKSFTSWRAPKEEYERDLQAYIAAIYDDEELGARVAAFVQTLEPGFVANALNQTLLKLMCPGVPDIYQGTELWDFSLVDPDNRRAVDYEQKKLLLKSLHDVTPQELWDGRAHGRVKLNLLRSGLGLRTKHPRCFGPEGAYRPLHASGSHSFRVVAFRRGDEAIAVVSRSWLKHGNTFGDTKLTLPEGTWDNWLTRKVGMSGSVPIGELLEPFPCAMLVRSQPVG